MWWYVYNLFKFFYLNQYRFALGFKFFNSSELWRVVFLQSYFLCVLLVQVFFFVIYRCSRKVMNVPVDILNTNIWLYQEHLLAQFKKEHLLAHLNFSCWVNKMSFPQNTT